MSEQFVDEAELEAIGGDGGDGFTSFETHPSQPRGGPDGGNGGSGGDVVIRADQGLSTLRNVSLHDKVRAQDGRDGGPDNKNGADGKNEIVDVPTGTIAYRLDTGQKIGSVIDSGDTLVVAQGGSGGRGNRCFTNSRRQSPKFHELGESGEHIPLHLKLELMADVGIIGKPNSGKSSLLAKLTSANPQIASHPFTTVSPNLGVLFKKHERLTLCDIPGIIENAHEGVGLGSKFLRHVERTNILIHMIDLTSQSAQEDFKTIRDEIKQYSKNLVSKPTIFVGNKIDKIDYELRKLIQNELHLPGPFLQISAETGTGLDKLKLLLFSMNDLIKNLDKTPPHKQENETVYKIEQKKPLRVQKIQDRFILKGEKVERLVKRFNLKNPEAQSYVRDQLLSIDLHHKLERAGCKTGDTIQVGNQVFEYTG